MLKDRTTGKLVRDGDPNADGFYAALYDNRAILAIADGCNWGVRSYRAARSALEGVSKYLLAHEAEMEDLRHAGHLLLRGLCEANRKIMEGVSEPWEAGTTTVLVGIVMEVRKEGDASAETEWGFLCGSVGDCKAFVWNKHTGAVTDVTLGNRCADTRDPGGRLGPYIGKDPDLRNLRLHYRALRAGDIITLCTDGVYDNFDPVFLGLSPRDIGLDYPAWENVPDHLAETSKEAHALRFAQSLIKKIDGQPTPSATVEAFVGHAMSLSEKTRQFMQDNPGKKQPSDYHNFPGKMDHTTAISYLVGGPVPSQTDVATPPIASPSTSPPIQVPAAASSDAAAAASASPSAGGSGKHRHRKKKSKESASP